ncbi:MAG: hypothetical protein LBC69_04315 [Eubacteriaceae bacterium]|jgi:hypothetical protein|nr:hypothetical protein [Eubacteriaceae bacterium]
MWMEYAENVRIVWMVRGMLVLLAIAFVFGILAAIDPMPKARKKKSGSEPLQLPAPRKGRIFRIKRDAQDPPPEGL